MSQSHQPIDSQALLQSMLQKLKLQPGRDGQAHLQTPGSPAEAFTLGSDREREGPNHQEVDNKPRTGFGFDNSPFKKASVPDGRFTQQAGSDRDVGRGWTSFHSQKVDVDGDTGERRVPGPTAHIRFSPKGTGQLFPVEPSKDVNLTHFKSTDGERMRFDRPMMANHVPLTTTMSQSYTPMWSHSNTAGEGSQVLHMENGGVSGSKESTDVQIFSGNQGTTNIRKKRPSENKTRRWTQRIKDRWKEKHSKKGREDEGTADQRTEQGAQISTTNQAVMAGNFTNMPNNHGETSLLLLGSCSPSKTFPAQTEDNTTDNIRRNSDFDLGLGSFSLLEEITKGQEWARFINPNLHTSSINQRPPEEPQLKTSPNRFNPNQTPGSLNQLGDGSGSWRFRSTEPSPAPVFGVVQIPPSSFSMDITEEKQESVYRGGNQVELMEDSQNQLDVQRRESRPGPPLGPSAVTQPSDILYNAVLKIRGQTSRKRQHQPPERARPVSAPPSSHTMEDTPEPQQGGVPPLDALKSPPLSPSSFDPLAPVPRGILKHSMSHDSDGYMTKRRRVEENRQVRFSEVVTAIASPIMDLDYMDSEEDSEKDSEKDSLADENSLLDQEFEEEQVMAEEVLRARRSAFPSWLKALKRKNTGKKHS